MVTLEPGCVVGQVLVVGGGPLHADGACPPSLPASASVLVPRPPRSGWETCGHISPVKSTFLRRSSVIDMAAMMASYFTRQQGQDHAVPILGHQFAPDGHLLAQGVGKIDVKSLILSGTHRSMRRWIGPSTPKRTVFHPLAVTRVGRAPSVRCPVMIFHNPSRITEPDSRHSGLF